MLDLGDCVGREIELVRDFLDRLAGQQTRENVDGLLAERSAQCAERAAEMVFLPQLRPGVILTVIGTGNEIGPDLC